MSHHVRYVAEHTEVMRVLVHEASSLPAGRRGEVRRLKERYFRIARDIVERLVADGCGRAARSAPPATGRTRPSSIA